jgi:hypothetical protein
VGENIEPQSHLLNSTSDGLSLLRMHCRANCRWPAQDSNVRNGQFGC